MLLLALAPLAAFAQPAGEYPNRPVRMVVPQAAGGALAHPEVRERLLKQGYEIHASTGEEYAAFMNNEIGRWSPIVKAAGIKIE